MRALALGLAAMLMVGCAPLQVRNSLTPTADQKLEYLQGAPLTRSIGNNSVVILALQDKQSVDGERIKVSIAAENIGKADFNFGVENISATDEAGRAIVPVPFDEIAAEIEEESRRSQAIARYMAYQALTAQTTTTTNQFGNFSGTASYNRQTYGPAGSISTYGNAYGSGVYSGQSISTTTNPAQNAAAANAWLTTGKAAQEEYAGKLGAAQATYLQTNTVRPGASVAGHLLLSPPPLKDKKSTETYTLVVTIGEDIHTFRIQRSPQK